MSAISTVYLVTGPGMLPGEPEFQEAFTSQRMALLCALDWAGDPIEDETLEFSDDALCERLESILNTTGEVITVNPINLVGGTI